MEEAQMIAGKILAAIAVVAAFLWLTKTNN